MVDTHPLRPIQLGNHYEKCVGIFLKKLVMQMKKFICQLLFQREYKQNLKWRLCNSKLHHKNLLKKLETHKNQQLKKSIMRSFKLFHENLLMIILSHNNQQLKRSGLRGIKLMIHKKLTTILLLCRNEQLSYYNKRKKEKKMKE